MDCFVRELRGDERDRLESFLYLAIFVPEGEAPPPREILNKPELQVYVRDFGSGPADCCLVAEAGGTGIGAAWARIMDDYGHVDDDTPSLAISLLPEWRGRGVGGVLLKRLLEALEADGYSRVSLSVQKANRAARLYARLGFETVEDRDGEFIMVRDSRRLSAGNPR